MSTAVSAKRRVRRRLVLATAGLVLIGAVLPGALLGRSISREVYAGSGVPLPTRAPDGPPVLLPAAIPGAPSSTHTDPSAPPTVDPETGDAQPTPVDLTSWAAQLGPVVGIPPVALTAYARTQVDLSERDPGCALSWPTLAGIGWVESQHGSYAGAVLGADGRSTPPIIGVPLDGAPNLAQVPDTDGGRLDGDAVLDRAVGPMQFIPQTWAVWASDGDGDGIADPFDVDDAALAAGRYLCAAGGDLRGAAGWTDAVFAYNASDSYVATVRAVADQYAGRSLLAAGQSTG